MIIDNLEASRGFEVATNSEVISDFNAAPDAKTMLSGTHTSLYKIIQ